MQTYCVPQKFHVFFGYNYAELLMNSVELNNRPANVQSKLDFSKCNQFERTRSWDLVGQSEQAINLCILICNPASINVIGEENKSSISHTPNCTTGKHKSSKAGPHQENSHLSQFVFPEHQYSICHLSHFLPFFLNAFRGSTQDQIY